VKVTITKNFWPFPTTYFQLQNYLNSDSYLGCSPYTLKCAGVTSDFTQEFFNSTTYAYWATQIQLLYRESTWLLKMPDVGWNFIGGGQKRRAMVFDFQNSEWVASPNPVGLDGSGAQASTQPAILDRRVNRVTPFASLLGVPPTTGTWPTGSL
jgi:hypothetical protein